MFFELWDVETRNLNDDFDTLDEALAATRELIQLNPDRYPEYLALAQVNDDETTTWIAKGASLAAMLEARNEPPAQRAV